jgi:threonine dehydrogenase-like Zn-dependent dehydrogenase
MPDPDLLEAVGDAALGQVIGRHFDQDTVAGQDAFVSVAAVADWRVDGVASGKIKVEPLLSAVAKLEEGGDWFHRLHKNTEGLLKVILKP